VQNSLPKSEKEEEEEEKELEGLREEWVREPLQKKLSKA
jgi:hypothetical protein